MSDPNEISTPLERINSLDEEPKQPSNIPNALEHALRSIDLKSTSTTTTTTKFTSKDVKHLFSGAPHFMLEKGRHNHWYPHALFPWDERALSIQNSYDREPTRHEAFTLATLHAHLPVPGVHHQGGDRHESGQGKEAEEEEEEEEGKGAKRATFDLGIFEVPNMLSNNGKEHGTVGVRHYLELPIADEIRYHAVHKATVDGVDRRVLSSMPLTQAFETLGHMRDAYAECNENTILDRRKLLTQGPEAWKRIGVRNVHTRTIVERFIVLSELRTEALEKNRDLTLLDREPVATLHEQLYTQLLHPPPKYWGHHHGNKKNEDENLKGQIEVLTKVLAVKGAWLDFSVPESRLRVGQVLWEMPPSADSSGRNDVERKWLLLQLLLAAELLLRLDAIVRRAVVKPSKNISVSSLDVRELDKLRHGKVNWDVLFVQRFMDNLKLKYCPATQLSSSSSPPVSPAPPQENARHGLLARFRRRQSQQKHDQCPGDVDSAWDCIFMPRHAERQLQGLSVFAAGIDWPNRDTIISDIRARTADKNISYNTPLHPPQSRKQENPYINLHQPSPAEPSGWLSRAWLTGLVLPGDSINALLMASLLEHDTAALSAIGSRANLRGGFSYKGASWWSTRCIAGRVLAAADESMVCMGWVKVSKKGLAIPRNQASGAEFGDTWFSVSAREAERKKNASPRIRQGVKLAVESHPLGHGEVSSSTFTIPVDSQQQQQQNGFQVQINSFDLSEPETSSDKMVTAKQASISFSLTHETNTAPISLSMPLAYNVHFISSFPCRPPRGSVVHRRRETADSLSESEADTDTASQQHHRHCLPGHPLHTSYSYKHVSLSSLRADTPLPEWTQAEPVWIVDARGNRDFEVFARAWCAAVGVDAVIGRVGRTCLACCVREARAVDVGVVIRVG